MAMSPVFYVLVRMLVSAALVWLLVSVSFIVVAMWIIGTARDDGAVSALLRVVVFLVYFPRSLGLEAAGNHTVFAGFFWGGIAAAATLLFDVEDGPRRQLR